MKEKDTMNQYFKKIPVVFDGFKKNITFALLVKKSNIIE